NHLHRRIEPLGQGDELRRRARVQAALIGNGDAAADDGGLPVRGRLLLRFGRIGHQPQVPFSFFSPCSTCEAAAMYFLPASWAQLTAEASGWFERTLASLTSIGRLTPAMTSTPSCSIIEIARLDGVPPNMSVSNTTP